MHRITMELNADELILQALKEDIPFGDILADAVLAEASRGYVDLIAKQSGVIAGLKVFSRVFELIDEDINIELMVTDGDIVRAGQMLAVALAIPSSPAIAASSASAFSFKSTIVYFCIINDDELFRNMISVDRGIRHLGMRLSGYSIPQDERIENRCLFRFPSCKCKK